MMNKFSVSFSPPEMTHQLTAAGLLILVLASPAKPALGETKTAAAHDPVAGLTCQTGWKVLGAQPCISLGDFRSLGSWNDPCVLRDGSRYVMYLTTAISMPGRPPVQPFRAVSENGNNWKLDSTTPLLTPGTDNEFDAQSVETPSVVRFGNGYHLYYTGVKSGLSGPMAIGHATSTDGITWTKDPRNPVLRPTGNATDFNGLQVAEPGAVVVRGRIHLYFAAVGKRSGGNPPARRVIALSQSSDGSTFDPSKIVLEQSDCYPARLGFDGYSTPAAAFDGHRVHLFYDVGYFNATAERKWSQVALHHAISEDGVQGWQQDSQPIITRRSFDWTALEVRSPAALLDGSTIHLWFAGNAEPKDFLAEVRTTAHTSKFGIGHLTWDSRKIFGR